MNVKIVEQKVNPFFARKELKAKLSYEDATPSKEALKKQLGAAMKTNVQLLVVKHLYQSFGQKEADILVYQYDSEEAMQKAEPKKKKAKPTEKKEEKPEAKEEEKKKVKESEK